MEPREGFTRSRWLSALSLVVVSSAMMRVGFCYVHGAQARISIAKKDLVDMLRHK